MHFVSFQTVTYNNIDKFRNELQNIFTVTPRDLFIYVFFTYSIGHMHTLDIHGHVNTSRAQRRVFIQSAGKCHVDA